VRRKIIDDPKVSIIIPTAYYDAQRNVLACLRSIAEKSSYWNYEIIIIHNSFGRLSLSEIRRIVPESVPITEIEYNERFNYSTVNNIAARKATGDYFIFLNDDTEVIAPDWIEAMLEHAQRPEVGIVGAKLLYPDNTVQHAGMVLADKGGGARHIFCRFPFESEVHQNFLNVVRNSSVVTFACVMVPKRVYSLVGGLDENLRLECNDTDFCLRVRKAGLLVVWTPFALLYHKEISTRKETFVAEDVKFLWSRWEQTLRAGDPYYNPNLAVDCEIPAISKRFCQGV
jgi:GT2 family glycosyltransferase